MLPLNLGIACLVDDKIAHAHPAPDQAEAYAQAGKKAIAAQQDNALAQEEEKAKLMQEKYKHQIEKRQKEKLAKKQQEQRIANAQQADQVQGILPAEDPVLDTPAKAETTESPIIKDSSHIAYSIVTPTSSDGQPWYKPDPLTSEIDALQSRLSISSQTFPMARSKFFFLDANNHFTESSISPEEAALNDLTKKGMVNNGTNWSDGSGVTTTSASSGDSEMQGLKNARIEVFRDLWKKGYFMGSGLKFGADFLVYPGKLGFFLGSRPSSPESDTSVNNLLTPRFCVSR